MPLTEQTQQAARRLVARYPLSRSALLPLLHLVQADHGYVSEEGIAFCAETLGLTKAEVGAVATFYTMFKREPVGDWLLSVCTNPVCDIAGGGEIYERFKTRCGGGHRNEEGTITVEHAECLGICDGAPIVQVNYEMYGPVTPDEAEELFDACASGEPPPSNWSKERPATFTQVAWDLSGAADGIDDELAEAAAAQVAAEVPPTRRSGETDIPVTAPGGDPAGVGGRMHRDQAGAIGAQAAYAEAGERAATAAGEPGRSPASPARQQPGVGAGAKDQADTDRSPTPTDTATDPAEPTETSPGSQEDA